MDTTHNNTPPEELSLAGEFSYYVLDNALSWPYFMGYVLLVALIIIGAFKSAWLEKLAEAALNICFVAMLLVIAGMFLGLVFFMIGTVLAAFGAPLVVVWNIAFMLTIGIGIIGLLIILRKLELLPA